MLSEVHSPPVMAARPQARATLVLGAVVLLALVGGLVTYKASGSLATIGRVGQTHTLQPRAELLPTGPMAPWARPFVRTLNYLAIVWPALVFGVLIGAAVRALVPTAWLSALVGGSTIKSQILGGLAGAPLMLCSCCVAPVFAAVHERTGRSGPAAAMLLAAPALNPAALALTFILFAPGIAWTRVVMSLTLVFGVSALAARLSASTDRGLSACPLEAEPQAGPMDALLAFAREVPGLAWKTLPAIVLGVVASSLLVEMTPPSALAGGALGALVVLGVALVSVPLALPTFAEIPLALGLLAAGAPPGAAVALLIAGPAINLPSLLTLKRMTSARYAAALGTGTFAAAALGGFLVS